jgi:hypothetical protein
LKRSLKQLPTLDQIAIEKRKRGISTLTTAYRDDPIAFVHDCFVWPDGQKPAIYQDEILSFFPKHRRVCVRGPHGLGKTALISWQTLWFALTRDGEDWKAPTTASAWRQLSKFLWPEIHKWARRLNWAKLERLPFKDKQELLDLSLKLSTGEAFALASDNSSMIEGAHAQNLLYVFDESKEIPPQTWDSAEGAFANGDTYWLAYSTPGEPLGRFYEIQSCRPGYQDWKVRHVTLDECIKAGRISPQWVEDRKAQWGEESAVYQNRVMGEFASSDEDGVIPLAWVEQANQRWQEWNESEKKEEFVSLGCDIARGGEDKTVLAARYGNVITEIRRYSKQDTMQTTGYIAGIMNANKKGVAVIDVIGIGAGVFDRLRENGIRASAFNAGEATRWRDRSNELGFINCRAAGWWNLRELLQNGEIALPPDDKLTGDLTAPKWRVSSGGKIQIESKDDIKKRIGRSTDDGDAVVMAFYSGMLPSGADLVSF